MGPDIAPVPRLLSAGVTVGLGTDGAVSSNTLDVLGAVRQAALVHKAGGDPTAVGAERAVRMATIDGAITAFYTDMQNQGLINQTTLL